MPFQSQCLRILIVLSMLSHPTCCPQILKVVLDHDGVLLMNGPPVTRTFREAALQAGPGRVMAEVEVAVGETVILLHPLYL